MDEGAILIRWLLVVGVAFAGCFGTASDSPGPLEDANRYTVAAACAWTLIDGSPASCGGNLRDIGARPEVPVTMACMIGASYDQGHLDWYHGPATGEDQEPPIQQGLHYAIHDAGVTAGVLWDLRDSWDVAYTWQSGANAAFIQPPIDGTGEGLEVAGIVYEAPTIDVSPRPDFVTVWWQIAYLGVSPTDGPLGPSEYESWSLSPVLEVVVDGKSWYAAHAVHRIELFGGSSGTGNATVGSNHSGNAQQMPPSVEDTWSFDIVGPGFSGDVTLPAWVFYAWIDSATDPFWTTGCQGPP